jgi:hypothetical protein
VAISVDYSGATFRINIPQADLTHVSGSLYELDTDAFWEDLKALEANETGIVFEDMQSHNPSYTVFGETYAPKVEILNASNSSNTDVYEVFFNPDTQYSVKLTGSNNNIADLQNAILANATTQVIPGNSAGLIIKSIGSGLSESEQAQLDDIESKTDELHKLQGLDSDNPMTVTPTSRSAGSIDQTISGDGETTSTVTRN